MESGREFDAKSWYMCVWGGGGGEGVGAVRGWETVWR